MAVTQTYLQSVRDALAAAMAEDPSVVVLGEDLLDPYGGAFKVSQGLSTRFPERVFTTPICEQTITGMAIGLALRGMRPVAELMFGDFITLASDQLVNHAAKLRAMYNGQVSVPMVLRTPMGGGRGYGPTHSQSLEKLFLGTPHIKVVAPSHFHDAGALLRMAVADPEPVVFCENKRLYPQRLQLDASGDVLQREELPAADGYPWVLVRNFAPPAQPDVTVVAYGGSSALVAPLMARLAEEEIRVVSCFPASLSPLDLTPAVQAATTTGRVVVVEEASADFGWTAEVAAQLYDRLHGRLRVPIQRVGMAPTIIPASKTLEQQVLVNEETILAAILEAMS